MNLVVMQGRATDRPTLRQGKREQYATFTLAVHRPFSKAKSDPTRKRADFIECIAFGRQAVNLRRHLPKGGLVLITGTLETFNIDVDGKTYKKYVVSVNNSDIVNWRRDDGSSNLRKRLEEVELDYVPTELDGMMDIHQANKRRTSPDVELIPSSKMAGADDDPYMNGIYDVIYDDELADSLPFDERREDDE